LESQRDKPKILNEISCEQTQFPSSSKENKTEKKSKYEVVLEETEEKEVDPDDLRLEEIIKVYHDNEKILKERHPNQWIYLNLEGEVVASGNTVGEAEDAYDSLNLSQDDSSMCIKVGDPYATEICWAKAVQIIPFPNYPYTTLAQVTNVNAFGTVRTHEWDPGSNVTAIPSADITTKGAKSQGVITVNGKVLHKSNVTYLGKTINNQRLVKHELLFPGNPNNNINGLMGQNIIDKYYWYYNPITHQLEISSSRIHCQPATCVCAAGAASCGIGSACACQTLGLPCLNDCGCTHVCSN